MNRDLVVEAQDITCMAHCRMASTRRSVCGRIRNTIVVSIPLGYVLEGTEYNSNDIPHGFASSLSLPTAEGTAYLDIDAMVVFPRVVLQILRSRALQLFVLPAYAAE